MPLFKKGNHYSPKTEFKKGRISVKYWLGKKHTKEYKLKMSLSTKRRTDQKFHFKSGENHLNWKGGNIAFQKNKALIRDNFTCKRCGLREVEIMEVDHILPKSVEPNLYKSIDNLVTLCPNDHARKTKEDWKKYQWGRKKNIKN